MAGKVFISYRREDDPAAAARVRDALAARFGKASLFMDVDSLSAGQRFEVELAKALTACDVLIVIIGTRWMDLLRSKCQMSGLRDFVRDEIAAALHRKIVVVPVRVGRENSLAPLPRAKDLPSDIRDLVNFQKYDVVHENFARDIAGLAEAIARVRQSRQPKRAFPWAWTGAAASIVLSMSALVYALHTTPVTVTWATSAQARTTGSVPQTQPHRDELEQAAAFINETADQARLEAFIKQFGDSAYAPMARARLEELRRRQIAVVSPPVNMPTINAPEVEPADKTAFVEAEASQDVKQLLRFIARFPNSSYRSKALFRLGYVYSNGEWGLLVDKPQARHWYRKAAELGSVGSMVNLAHLYEKGLGGPRDHAEARRLYTKVTELPNVSDRAKRYAEEGLARMRRTW